ncbi:hypothetical protein [Actinomadura sp. DC4]|uniref:hypothetical protein n=1 Tax=Actinomadura sp. DC4 TaxID=3055069 RepID=UPI0025B13E4C|nr:hypothetical protein [Actinomadura sp. DC4]MDN3357182.1 hypothetical protein [Actinomadura sp. DC4]
MSVHRHAARPARRRGRFVAAGCAAAVLVVALGAIAWGSGIGRDRASAVPSRAASAENSPMSTLQGSEREVVPSACDTLGKSVADKLAPGADRSATVANQSDQHSECSWGLYGASRSRQLNVELRAIGAGDGTSGTGVATKTFEDEWRSDRAGNDLADSAKVRDSRGVTGVGEQAYVVYTVDSGARVGEAIANARLANVLITVHYSGGDHRDTKGTPLSSGAATDGALLAARDVVSKLESHS